MGAGTGLAATTDSHLLDAHDLVMMKRVGDPQLAPDARRAAFTLRTTEPAANKGVTHIYMLDLTQKSAKPHKLIKGNAPCWSPDGKTLYFLAENKGHTALERIGADGGKSEAVSDLALSINNYKLSPDGRHVLLSIDVFMDCKDKPLACTREKLDACAKDKASGRLYTHLLERHWDAWSDGWRSQLFLATLGSNGKLEGHLVWLTQELDGNIPSKHLR